MLILNQLNMLMKTLCSPAISIEDVACVLREAAARITPRFVHDGVYAFAELTPL